MQNTVLVAVLGATAVACSSLDNISVEVEDEVTIPEGSTLEDFLGSLDFLGFEGFDITTSKTFDDLGYSKQDVDSVHLERVVLTITDPEDAGFGFLESVTASVEAEGLPRVEVARLTEVPDEASEIELVVSPDVELEPYVTAPEMSLQIEASGVRPPQETTVEARAVFSVDIDVSGVVR